MLTFFFVFFYFGFGVLSGLVVVLPSIREFCTRSIMLPRQNMAPANDWMSLLQALNIYTRSPSSKKLDSYTNRAKDEDTRVTS